MCRSQSLKVRECIHAHKCSHVYYDFAGAYKASTGLPFPTFAGPNGSFVASASGAWQNAPGTIGANNSLYLDCCETGGITGSVNDLCTLASWNDGQGSEWSRPLPPIIKNVTISNVLPRVDDTGAILRVQDGCLAQFDGIFYLYGARYQCCPVSEQPECYDPCGYRNATFAVYSSHDLEVWHLENDNLFPIMTDPTSPHSNVKQAYFEPCVMYSPAADHYALWFLYLDTKAVAVSDSPLGPFESVSWDMGMEVGSDAYFWTENATGTVYVKHNGDAVDGLGSHYVSRLSPDLLSVEATSAPMSVPALPVPPYYQGKWPTCSEGGGIFQGSNMMWYVMAGSCCCFCAGGANAYVWMSSDPLGPYLLQASNHSGYPGNIMPWNATQGKYLSGAQQFSVAPIPTTSGVVPVYIGQRFGSADDGLKCHDYQYWGPLTILPDGTVQEMAWVDDFTIEIATVPV